MTVEEGLDGPPGTLHRSRIAPARSPAAAGTRAMRVLALVAILAGLAALPPDRAAAECVSDAAGGSHCLYRSLLPSSGIVASCRDDRDCRVGYYYGDPGDATWFPLPEGMTAFPKPEVSWPAAMLAQVRFDCGRPCSVSYFFEVRRKKASGPRRFVLAVDASRLLVAQAEARALVVRQVFSGREVARIERDWSPAPWLGDVITALAFDPDGRLSLTWLSAAGRVPVSERLSIPTVPR